MSDATLSLLVLGCAIGLFVWNRLPVALVAVLTALALAATGLVEPLTAISGFGDPVVVFIASLFVLSDGLESSGVTTWAGQQLLARAQGGRARLVIMLMGLAAVMGALISPNGAAAALLPVLVLAARRAGLATSQLAMPVAYGASAGALLVMTGSVVNVIVSDALTDLDGHGFNFFSFTIMGLPLVVATTAVMVLFGPRLLPKRTPSTLPADFSDHIETLVEHYRLENGFFRLRVESGSPLVGRTIDSLEAPDEVIVIGAQDVAGKLAPLERQFRVGDVLVASGPSEGITDLAAEEGLVIAKTPLTRETRTGLLGREVGVAELVVPPRSPLVGQPAFPGQRRGEVVVLSIKHLGKDSGPQPVTLVEGDAMLVHGAWARIEALSASDDVLVVNSPELVRRQIVPLGPKAKLAMIVMAVTVILLAAGLVPPAVAGLVGATGMVLVGAVSTASAFRAISWETVVLIGGLIPLSIAIQDSGLARMAADLIVDIVPAGNGYLLLIALFLLTAALGQVISNTATVLIVTPIAVAAATATGIAAAPVLMLVAVAGAASFLTPIATPANMMVMGPGGYKFGDYWRIGIVTMVAWLALSLLLIPIFWPFG